jgi:hypothetical protein
MSGHALAPLAIMRSAGLSNFRSVVVLACGPYLCQPKIAANRLRVIVRIPEAIACVGGSGVAKLLPCLFALPACP